MSATSVQKTIEAVWRIEQAKIIAAIARMVRDVGLAEEFAQDALVTALAQWPEKGVPDKPAAWLMATGKRRAIDHLRRAKMLDRKHGEIGYEHGDRAGARRRPTSRPCSTTTSATIS